MVLDPNNDYDESINYVNCKYDKYLGPFSSGYSIMNFLMQNEHLYSINGEFQLLLLDYNKKELFSDNIQIKYKEYRITNILEIKKIDNNLDCPIIKGQHALFQI